jgi:hypothetical protein
VRCEVLIDLKLGGRSVAKFIAQYFRRGGGGGGIRTPETLSGLTVFKTAGFNRSPTPPFLILTDPVIWSAFETI